MKAMIILPAFLLIAAAPTLTRTDRVQALAAAGFVAGKTCATGNPSWPKSQIEVEAIDLNSDGKFEAIVTESNVACYGNTGSGFTIVGKDAAGKWKMLGGDTGVPVPLKSKRMGWLDVQVGGPGFGKMPVLRWDGKKYR